MTIYKLDIAEVHEPAGAIISSYKAPRALKSSEYFLSEASAIKRREEIYEGIRKLIGFMPPVEVTILEIEVRE